MDEASTRRLASAVEFALECHRGQRRKGTDIPYISHPLQVAGMVLEHGGDIDQAMAGLLHDAVEDCADVTLDVVRERCGARVTEIVADCTDTFEGDTPDSKAPWKKRKERSLDHLRHASDASVLVYACDKVHNLRTLVSDVRTAGLGYLEQFNSAPEEQVWYYGEILKSLGSRLPARLRNSFCDLVAEFSSLVAECDR